MAPVGGRVEEHVVRLGPHRTVEHALEHLVGRLPFLEREIIDEDDETLGPSLEAGKYVGQIDQIGLLHFHQPQPPIGVLGEQRLDQGRLPRAARAREQHVVRRTPGQELLGVAHHARLLRLDVLEIVEPQAMRPTHGLQHAATAHAPVPVGQTLFFRPAHPRRFLTGRPSLQHRGQALDRGHQSLHVHRFHRLSTPASIATKGPEYTRAVSRGHRESRRERSRNPTPDARGVVNDEAPMLPRSTDRRDHRHGSTPKCAFPRAK